MRIFLFLQARKKGVPVITLNARGCNDLIKDHVNGLLLQENSSAMEIKEAILNLYHDRELLRRLSDNAIKNRAQLSRHLYVNEQINIYENIVNEIKQLN